jgi:hypothetical protein
MDRLPIMDLAILVIYILGFVVRLKWLKKKRQHGVMIFRSALWPLAFFFEVMFVLMEILVTMVIFIVKFLTIERKKDPVPRLPDKIEPTDPQKKRE